MNKGRASVPARPAALLRGAVGLLAGSLLAGRARPKRPVLAANLGLATYALPLAYILGPLAADAWGPATPLWIAAALVGIACAGTAGVPGVRRFGVGDGGGSARQATPGDTGLSKNVSSDTVA